MLNGLEPHLRYLPVEHREGCTKGWEVAVFENTGHRRYPDKGHACKVNETDPEGYDCSHGDTFEQTTVRLLCRGCGAAVELDGERVRQREHAPEDIGIDLAPKRVGDLWLHAGPRRGLYEGNPGWYVVATRKTGPLTEADVVGEITIGTTKRGAIVWSAAAGLDIRANQQHGDFFRHGWHRRSADTTFKTPTAAARWVAGQLAELAEQSADQEPTQ
ncbi:hypothetical protein OG618_37625 (plasmid) [Kitasatospora sp. NBC_01246]|uniref:hypothetical protein n=1 Tax=Kitasatospora sp. NBC_01246 TaxID=2903570 RepID=UPI002E377E14|nr:hypothetical protein [Kitasatospora sp. NBC_01246]